MEPVMKAAWVADVRASRATKNIRGGDVSFMFVLGENQVSFFRRRKQIPSRAAPRSADVPASGTACVWDDQLNLPSGEGLWAVLWVVKSQIAGVASNPGSVLVMVPVPEISKRVLF